LSILRERIKDLPRYRAARQALEQARVAAGTAPGQQLAMKESEYTRRGAASLPEGVSAERIEEARACLLALTGRGR
jgi:hypothetical protein